MINEGRLTRGSGAPAIPSEKSIACGHDADQCQEWQHQGDDGKTDHEDLKADHGPLDDGPQSADQRTSELVAVRVQGSMQACFDKHPLVGIVDPGRYEVRRS